jgi:hypothetical protein
MIFIVKFEFIINTIIDILFLSFEDLLYLVINNFYSIIIYIDVNIYYYLNKFIFSIKYPLIIYYITKLQKYLCLIRF